MRAEGESKLPPCEFQADKLILQVDELVNSEINAISPVVDRLMLLIKESEIGRAHV